MSSKNIDLALAGFFICLLFHTQLSFSYSLIGSQLTDLQTNDPVGFQSEANNWVLSSLRNANTFSFCNGNYILGGYSVLGSTSGQYFERLYRLLPSHTEIQFSIKFWILDNWGSSDYFQLEFDNQLLTIWSLYMRTGAVDVCGDGYPDLPGVYIQGKIKHSATSLTLRITSQLSLDTTLQSFGFRNIEINFLNTILPVSYTNQLCTIAPISLPSSITTCSCSQTQYESPSHSGKCFQCNQNCATCTGGASSSCTSCHPGSFFSGTQCISCDASCGTCTGSGPTKCSTCASGYRLNTDDTGITCIAIKIIDDFSPSFLNAPIEAGTLTFLALYPPLQYLRYLNITMSPRLGLLAQSQGRPILSLRFGFRMPEIWQESFIKYPLSPMLEKQDLHSSFFVNFWPEFSSLLIILMAALVFSAFERSFKKLNQKFPEKICSVLRIITAWNFCFILAATAIGNIIIFSAIEFSNFESSEDSLANFSLAFCIIVIIAIIIFIFGTIVKVKRVVKEQIATQGVDPNNIPTPSPNKHQGSQVLFSGFKRNTIFGTFFFVIYTFRLSFPIFLAACMKDAQLAQVILQVLINASIIVCLLITKPLKSKINFVQLTLFELIIFVINILILALTISNDQSDNATESKIHIGDVIIVGNFAINVLVIVFLVIKIFVGVKRIFNSSKENSRQDKAIAYIQLLAIPMHQGGMGFEQVFPNSLNDEIEDVQPKPKDTTLNSPVTIISRTFASIFSQKVTNSKSKTTQKLPAVPIRSQNGAPLQDISISNSSILPMFNGSRSLLNTNRTLETERQETYIMEPNKETEKFETMIENDRMSPIKMSDPDRLEPSIEPYSFMGKTPLYQIEEAEEMPSTSTVQNITEIQRPFQGKGQTDTDAYENMLQAELEKLYSDFLSNSMADNEKLPVYKAQIKPKIKKAKGSSSQRSLNRGSMKKVGSSSQITSGSKSQLSTHRDLDSERGDKNSTQPTRPRSNKTLEVRKSENEIYSGIAPQKEALSRSENIDKLPSTSLHQGHKEDLTHLEKKSRNPQDIDERDLQVEIDKLYSDFIATSSVEKPYTVRNHLRTQKIEKMGNEPIRRSKSNKGLEAHRSEIDHIYDDIVTQKDASKKKEELPNIDLYQDLQGNSKPKNYKDIDEKTLQLEIDQLYSEFLVTSEAEKAHTVKSQNKSIQKRQMSPRKDRSASQSKHNTHRALESERNEIAAIASTRCIPDKRFEIQSLEGTDYSFTTRKIPMHKIEETKEIPNSSTIQNDVESSRPSQIKGESRIEIDDNALQLELEQLFADVLANTETTTKSKNKSEKMSSRNSRQRFVDRNKATPPKSERGIEEPSIIYKEEDYDYSEDQLFEMLGVSSQKKTNVREAPRRWKP